MRYDFIVDMEFSCLSSLIILWLFESSSIAAFVLTKFDQIEEFSYWTMKSEDYRIDSGEEQIYPVYFVNTYVCNNLREARVFEIGDRKTRTQRHYHSQSYVIPKGLLDSESDLIKLNMGVEEFEMRDEVISMFSFPCISLKGEARWTVVLEKGRANGFLFEIDEISSGEKREKVVAVIDLNADIVHESRSARESLFIQSSNMRSVEARESLCSRHRIMKLRICSICADAIHESKVVGSVMDGGSTFSVSKQIYSDPFSNFYYPHDNMIEDCPALNVTMSERYGRINHHVYGPFLRCDVTIKGNPYKFYLSENLAPSDVVNTVFVIEEYTVNYGTVFGVSTRLQILLLESIDILDHLYKDTVG